MLLSAACVWTCLSVWTLQISQGMRLIRWKIPRRLGTIVEPRVRNRDVSYRLAITKAVKRLALPRDVEHFFVLEPDMEVRSNEHAIVFIWSSTHCLN